MRALSTSFLLIAASAAPLTAADDVHVEIQVSKPAACSRPTRSGDKVSVHYKGSLQSTGDEFDQSYNRGQPFFVTLGKGSVIEGWEQGLLDMCPGEARRLIIPPELGYGKWGAPPAIPGGATLVFETELMDIVGVEQENITLETLSATEDMLTIATAPPTPLAGNTISPASSSRLQPTPEPSAALKANAEGQCNLLGPFALLVQGALGAAAITALVIKRWREEQKRPWTIWFFDVSKQVLGSILLHILNLAMSMVSDAPDVMHAAKHSKESKGGDGKGPQESLPNPCSFYLLNLGIDTTIGIPVLYLLLKVLHSLFSRTPLARPQESIKTGNYGSPPKIGWWLKQSLIYFFGLALMKLFVFFLFAALPWLPWVGDWALRWTEGNEALQIAFVMFIFPLTMNATQYWIIDNFIMDKSRKKNEGQGYQQVGSQDDDDDRTTLDEDSVTEVEHEVQARDVEEGTMMPPLKEVNPTPIPSRDGNTDGETSTPTSPHGPMPPSAETRTHEDGKA